MATDGERRLHAAEHHAAALTARHQVDISGPALQARVVALQGRHFHKPISPPTESAHKWLLALLSQMLQTMSTPDTDLAVIHLAPGGSAKPLSKEQWQTFAYWLASRSLGRVCSKWEQHKEGNLDGVLTRTALRSMYHAISAWHRFTHVAGPSKSEQYEIDSYICTELTAELGLKSDARPKPVGTSVDFLAMLKAVYTRQLPFRLAEERLAFCATFKIIAYTASRPGEVILHPHYKQHPDALKWGDIVLKQVIAASTPSSETPARGSEAPPHLTKTIIAVVTIRLLKGKRNDKSAFTIIVLMHYPKHLLLCPVIDILALALCQGVIEADQLDAIFAPMTIQTRPSVSRFHLTPALRTSTLYAVLTAAMELQQ